MPEQKSSLLWSAVLYGVSALVVAYTIAGVNAKGGWAPILLLIPMLAILLPPVRTRLDPKGRYLPGPKWSIGVAAVLLVVQASLFGEHAAQVAKETETERQKAFLSKQAEQREHRKSEFASSKADILSTAEGMLTANKAQEALALANQYLAVTKDPDLVRLQSRANLAVMKQDLANEDSLPIERRAQIYTTLMQEEPGSFGQYREKLDKVNEALAIKKKMQEAAAQRAALEAKVQSQFSGYDGSHRKVEAAIKASMHNPDSYEHVETRYQAGTEAITVVTTFRGTNKFGAVVTNRAIATVDADGNVLSLESQ